MTERVRDTSERRARTRLAIVKAADRLFRRDGIDATGLDAVMAEAGLTHGAFYLHFRSKEALVAEVVAGQLRRVAAHWEAAGPHELAVIVAQYLDTDQHCVLPALGPDLARLRPGTDVTESIGRMAAAMGRLSDPADAAAGRAALATMVGAVVLARAVDDPRLQDDILVAALGAVKTKGIGAGPLFPCGGGEGVAGVSGSAASG